MEATAYADPMVEEVVLPVAEQFSPYPSGHTEADGPNNAQAFLGLLVPIVKNHSRVVLDLDGIATLPASFLTEVFKGLMRSGVVGPKDVCQRLELRATDPELQAYIPIAKQLAREEAEALAI